MEEFTLRQDHSYILETKETIQVQQAWSYDPITQTATGETIWETIDKNGASRIAGKVGRWNLHCFFRYEMEHLLARSGFEVLDLYGDFKRTELSKEKSEMIFGSKKVAWKFWLNSTA